MKDYIPFDPEKTRTGETPPAKPAKVDCLEGGTFSTFAAAPPKNHTFGSSSDSASSQSQPPHEEESSPSWPELPAHGHPTDDWRCGYCGNPTTIDEVCPSLDGQRWLTLWHCEPCQSYCCTPDAVKSPPVWVKRTEQ